MDITWSWVVAREVDDDSPGVINECTRKPGSPALNKKIMKQVLQ